MRDITKITTATFVILLCACALAMPAVQGCAIFDRFKPIITTAGHELLLELDKLLTEYEQSALPIAATVDETLDFALNRAALRAKIDNRLYHASLEAPADAVRPYRKRLHALPTAGP